MTNSVKIGAYTQHQVKHNTSKSAQTDSFSEANESNVLNYSHNASDVAEISQEAKDILNNPPESAVKRTTEQKDMMADWNDKFEQMRRDMNWLRDELRRAGEAAEGVGESMREMIKCLRIAMRIMSGHNVPIPDHRYLMEKDSALYSKAIMMRREIPDPEDLERISEDEEENEDSSEIDEVSTSSGDISANASGDTAIMDNAVDIEV